MKKKYVSAKLEIVLAEVCDVITTSVIQPEDPEQNEPNTDGGGHNPDGWVGI